jgi:hypothetical protein
VEEFFLHLWDELDDLAGVCRHVATTMAAEVVVSAPAIAAAAGSVLAGAATLMLSYRRLLDILG